MDISIEKKLTASELQAVLRSYLPTLVVSRNIEAWASLPSSPSVAFWLFDEPPEYPADYFTAIDVNVRLRPGFDIQDWIIELSRVISVVCQCKTACDGSGFGDNEGPFWLIVWDRGTAFLAEDSEVDRADKEPGPVKIIRPLPDIDLCAVQGGLNGAVEHG